MRDLIKLSCEECGRDNYVTDKNKRNMPEKMEIKKFAGRAGSSQISVTGYLQNYLAYFMMEGQELKGKMALTSPRFNVNEWLVEEGEEAAASTQGLNC